VLRWVLVVGFLLLLLGGGGVAVWFFLLRAKKPTEEQFRKLALDMTEPEVLTILGPPSRTQNAGPNNVLGPEPIKGFGGRSRTNANRVHYWEFGEVEVRAGIGKRVPGADTLVFCTGKFGDTILWVNETTEERAGKEKYERENKVDRFEDVVPGMTEADLVQKHGKPTSSTTIERDRLWMNGLTVDDVKRPDGSLKPTVLYTYIDERRRIEHVLLVDGKVYKRNPKSLEKPG
jgi:hypothetical protein